MTGTQGNTIGAINPFRYRGYYWDEESWLYYLNSRYYDAVTGRFLNADNCVSTGGGVLGYNMFAYCYNNPVMLSDSAGNWPSLLKALLQPIKNTVSKIVNTVKAVSSVTKAINKTVAKAAKKTVKIVTVAALVTPFNRLINNSNEAKISQEVKPLYTREEAKAAAEAITTKYDSTCKVTYNDAGIKITNSYLITQRYDRQKISMIFANSGVTDRSYSNLAAEWELHNKAYEIFSTLNVFNGGKIYDDMQRAMHVDLDYFADSHRSVRWATKILEVIGWQ